MTWLHKLLDPLNISPWKTLLLETLQKFGGDNTLYLNNEGLSLLANRFNSFLRDIFNNSKQSKTKTKGGRNIIWERCFATVHMA